MFGFYSAGVGRLCTVPCVRFYIKGGARLRRPPPVFGFVQQGGAALYRPLCFVFLWSLLLRSMSEGSKLNHLKLWYRKKSGTPVSSLKPVNVDPAHKSQVNYDPTTEIKSISSPTLFSSRFGCPGTKIELISVQTLKPSHFRPPHKTKSVPTLPLKSNQFRPPTNNQINLVLH